ncbi:Endonuclease/exonuclease/phosphatase [Mycena rebaudengoi]|nr:Endonuclease/exonuclease/phosphatase [Mycena rebaudengoi]
MPVWGYSGRLRVLVASGPPRPERGLGLSSPYPPMMVLGDKTTVNLRRRIKNVKTLLVEKSAGTAYLLMSNGPTPPPVGAANAARNDEDDRQRDTPEPNNPLQGNINVAPVNNGTQPRSQRQRAQQAAQNRPVINAQSQRGPQCRKKIRKRTKGYIKFTTLNMCGRYHQNQDKWKHINQIMRDKRVGIASIQETHLRPEDVDDIHKLFGKRLQVYASADPVNPTGARGVAIVVNKEISNIEGITCQVLHPGRALRLTIPWHGNSILNVVAVYAPNDSAENARFLEEINDKLKGLPQTDVLLGDFNMVEDGLDRMPHHRDPANVTTAMLELKSTLRLQDGWRQTFPDTKAYTFLQKATNVQSRIDRILVSAEVLKNSSDWTIEASGIHTDHQLVSFKYSDPRMPFIGKGRWVLPLHLLKDRKIMDRIAETTKECAHRINMCKNNRSEEENPQAILEKYIEETCSLFRDRAKVVIPKMDKDISEMKNKLKKTLNDPLIGEDERQIESSTLQEKIDALEAKRHMKIRDNTAASNRLHGESTATKHWTQTNKARAPRDTISSLQIPGSNPPTYETRKTLSTVKHNKQPQPQA